MIIANSSSSSILCPWHDRSEEVAQLWLSPIFHAHHQHPQFFSWPWTWYKIISNSSQLVIKYFEAMILSFLMESSLSIRLSKRAFEIHLNPFAISQQLILLNCSDSTKPIWFSIPLSPIIMTIAWDGYRPDVKHIISIGSHWWRKWSPYHSKVHCNDFMGSWLWGGKCDPEDIFFAFLLLNNSSPLLQMALLIFMKWKWKAEIGDKWDNQVR